MSVIEMASASDFLLGIRPRTFEQAVEFLKGRKPITFDQAREKIHQIRKFTRVAKMAHELGLDRRAELTTLATRFDFDTYIEAFIGLLGEFFPVMDDLILQEFWEEGEPYLYFYPQGMNGFSDEDIYEIFENPTILNREIGLDIFVFCLNFIDHVSAEAWDRACLYFCWGEIDYPLPEGGGLDRERLGNLLAEAGMTPFLGALHIAMISDNPFFTFRIYSDDDWDPIEFSADNVRYLAEEWQEAQHILSEFERAVEMVQQDASLYRKFLELWTQCLTRSLP